MPGSARSGRSATSLLQTPPAPDPPGRTVAAPDVASEDSVTEWGAPGGVDGGSDA